MSYLALDVQRQCFSWVKLPTTNFRTVYAKHLLNAQDREDFSSNTELLTPSGQKLVNYLMLFIHKLLLSCLA